MKHAKKMILLTEEEYKSKCLKPQKTKSKKSQRKPEKLLGERNRTKHSIVQYKQKMGSMIQDQLAKERKLAGIESFFDPKYQSTVKAILAELKDTGVSFNSNRELKLAHGDTVPGSNIIDLMRELLVGATSPKDVQLSGWKEFMAAIAYSNLPLSIFTKTTSKSLLRKLRWEEY